MFNIRKVSRKISIKTVFSPRICFDKYLYVFCLFHNGKNQLNILLIFLNYKLSAMYMSVKYPQGNTIEHNQTTAVYLYPSPALNIPWIYHLCILVSGQTTIVCSQKTQLTLSSCAIQSLKRGFYYFRTQYKHLSRPKLVCVAKECKSLIIQCKMLSIQNATELEM